MRTVSLSIDGKSVTASAGTTILNAAAAAGIDIPHLCYDPRVEPIGSCRLCGVKVEGMRGLIASCGQAVSDGMKITTEDGDLALHRRQILQLLLSDHSPTCTTCDKSGNCRLQDYAYRYHADQNRFGPLTHQPGGPNYTTLNKGILYDAEKCIKCGLCVKYCETVQMADALTFAWRAKRLVVTTPFEEDLHKTTCELCGGCIRVCPVGAMLDKSAVGMGREKDLRRVRTTCSYCGVGCQMDLVVDKARNRIVRVTAEPGATINGGNLCVKGHFGFEFVASKDRLTHPLIRKNGSFEKATWDEAVEFAGRRLRELRDKHGADAVAFVSSSRCSNEENYLMQKLARTAGSTNNVDNCAST
jgi:formate dehydrogenase alpha subunit